MALEVTSSEQDIASLTIKYDIENKKERWAELIADRRYLIIWHSRGRKTIQYAEGVEKPIVEVYAEVVDALRSMYFPMIPTTKASKELEKLSEPYRKIPTPTEEEAKEWDKKREELFEKGELKPRKLEKEVFPPLEEIDALYVEALDDNDLIELYKYLVRLAEEQGRVWEDVYNAGIFTGIELFKRNLWYKVRGDDILTKAIAIHVEEYPPPDVTKPVAETSKEYTFSEIFNAFPEMISIDLAPSYIYLSGSIVNTGKVKAPLKAGVSAHDIDVVVKGPYDRRIVWALARALPPEIANGLHFIWDYEGPAVGYTVPLYNLAFKKVSYPVKLSPWQIISELSKADATLFKPHISMKSKTGLGKAEWWKVEDAWNTWAKEHIDYGIHIQPKLDGRRMQVHFDKAKRKVAIYTEDRKRDRAEVFPDLVEEILTLKADNGILDTEFVCFDITVEAKTARTKMAGQLIPREDTASITVGTPTQRVLRGLVVFVHDILYLNGEPLNKKPYSQRINIVYKLIPKDLKYLYPVNTYLATNKQEFFKYSDIARRTEGSEGAMFKRADSQFIIKYQGESRTGLWCLPAGQYVLCNPDIRTIEEIQVNTQLLDSVVEEKVEQEYSGDLIVIKPMFCLPLKLTPEHRVLALDGLCRFPSWKDSARCSFKCRNRKYCHKPLELSWKEARSLTTRDRLSYPRLQINQRSKYSIEILKFFGWYLAEGYTDNGRICITLGKEARDKAIEVYKLAKYFDSNAKLYHENRKDKSYRIQIWNPEKALWLEKQFGKGASNKKIPFFILKEPSKRLRAFLDSYVAGDGYQHKNGIQVATKSFTLINQLQIAYAKLGLMLSIHKDKKGFYHGWITNTTGKRQSRKYEVLPDRILIPIKKITREPYQGKIYHIQTNTGTFYAPVEISNSKIKNLKELSVMVWKRIPKVTKEGKVLDTYMYDVYYLIPEEKKDEFYGVVEYKGKYYAPLGRTYSTSLRLKRGDILDVMTIRIREYEKDGKRLFSLAEDRVVPLWSEQGFETLSLKELWERGSITITLPEGEYKPLTGYNTLTCDGLKPIKGIFRHFYSGDLVKLQQYLGETVCSPEHSILSKDGEWRNAKDNPDLRRVKAPSLGMQETVRIRLKGYKSVGDKLYLIPSFKGKIIPRKQLPYSWSDKWVLKTYQGKELESLLKFLGAYLAEGSASKNQTSWRVRISNQDRSWLNEIAEAVQMFSNANWELTRKGKASLVIWSKPIYDLVTELCGKGSKNKHVPPFIFSLTPQLVETFMREVWRGDGISREYLSLVTKSRKLATGWCALLSALQIDYSLSYQKDGVYQIIPVKYHQQIEHKKKLTIVPYSGYLYDLVMNPSNHFVDGIGLVAVHNTWMFPTVLRARPDLKQPDTLTTVERIAAVDVAPLSKEEVVFELCPFSENYQICPLLGRIVPLSRLRFPVKCPFAYDYRCKYIKQYYYEDKELDKPVSMEEEEDYEH